MKKLVTVVVILAFSGMTVFAAPASVAMAELSNNFDRVDNIEAADVFAVSLGDHNQEDELFEIVQADPLTSEEADQVEGGEAVAVAAAIVAGGLVGLSVVGIGFGIWYGGHLSGWW